MSNLIAVLLKGGFSLLNRGARATARGTVQAAGLTAPVEVLRDRWGIPHLYANDAHDMFFAQGFMHAQDRLWQMELNRRIAGGQLAAVFGEAALPTDQLTRTLGLRRLAEADYELLSAHERDMLAAYAAGVNARLERGRLPAEFKLLRLRPEAWTPVDSLAIVRLMMFNLSTGWAAELVRAALIEKLGAARAADLDLHFPERDVPTLPEGVVFNRLLEGNLLQAERGPFLEHTHDAGRGSNAWALAGSRTTTGHALLCNDMHLRITTPGVWHLAHLRGGEYHVTGASLAGAPGVAVGHNDRIAWGCTLAFTDNQDLFVERLHPDDPRRYEYRGEWLECATREEEIEVKDRLEAHVETVRETRHGPLVGGLIVGGGEGLALSSYALRPGRALEGFARLDRARGWDDFVEAMRCISAPPLNVVYADVEGNIGHWTTGTLPLRANGRQGAVPAAGWTGEDEWVGEVPFEEMPHALNPPCGYIVNCNNCLVQPGSGYKHFLGLDWMNGYRAQRVTAEIERLGKVGPDDCRALQLDFHSLPGGELAQRLRDWKIAPADADAALGLRLLLEWDLWLGAESVGGAVYQVMMRKLLENLAAPALGEELFARFLGGRGPHRLLAPNSEFSGHATVTVLAMLDAADSAWVREAGGRAAVVERSLREAVAWLRERLGPDPAGWQWGRLHQITAPHALSLRRPLVEVFGNGPLPIGGDTDTVCQTAFVPDAPYHPDACAPSYREIVDLGDLERSVHIAPPGNSGVLGDAHYGDLMGPWQRGEYVPALWGREAVEREAVERIRLEP